MNEAKQREVNEGKQKLEAMQPDLSNGFNKRKSMTLQQQTELKNVQRISERMLTRFFCSIVDTEEQNI